MPGGDDSERFRPPAGPPPERGIRSTLGLPADVPIVGLVSGFRVMKGHQTAVEAAARLAAAGRRVHLLLIGQGPFVRKVRAQIGAAGLGDRISILGYVDDLPAVMAAVDVALYPAVESDGMASVIFGHRGAGGA